MVKRGKNRRGLVAGQRAVPAEWIMAFAAAVAAALYLSVTLRATLYGDDCINNPSWYYRLTHDGLWALLQGEWQSILSGLRGRSGRFFPFFLPLRSFTAAFKGSISAYRLYIIAYTLADAAGLGALLARTLHSKNSGLAYFALLPLMLCLWCHSETNALYSYEALPQAALGGSDSGALHDQLGALPTLVLGGYGCTVHLYQLRHL